MQIPGAFSRLRETLLLVLNGTPTRDSIRDLVEQFHAFATVYLKSLVQRGRVRPYSLNLSLTDIAVDCIAPLFERDAAGRFSQLLRYYDRLGWRACSPEELAAHTRRLVCSSVHQGVRHLWRENDHSLANILRNLKAGVLKSRTLQLVEDSGELYVAIKTVRHHELAEMSQEYLDAHVSPFVATESTIPRILERLSEFLREERRYRQRIPLVMLAITIRCAATRAGSADEGAVEPWDALSAREAEEFIIRAVGQLGRTMTASYVRSGKMDEACLRVYLEAVRRLLECRYVRNDCEKATLYSILLESMPGLSRGAYRNDHRNRLEYLYHRAEQDLLEALRRDLS